MANRTDRDILEQAKSQPGQQGGTSNALRTFRRQFAEYQEGKEQRRDGTPAVSQPKALTFRHKPK